MIPSALYYILLMMAGITATSASAGQLRSAAQISSDPQGARALAWLEKNVSSINEEQARITAIPAPPFHEAERGAYLKKLLASAGLRVSTDKSGNIIGELSGSNDKEIVMVTAHLDTVFPAGTDVRVKREGGRLIGPGISDNGTGLAALVGIARALKEAKLKPERTILFVADVGEEGEGNLRGMRTLVETYKPRLKFVIALDGAGTDYVTTKALASRRMEIKVTGPGGHSWSDFGLPNPINALARAITRFIQVKVPESPRTTFNVGQIAGGTSVNSIPFSASVKVDLRSEQGSELDRLEAELRRAMQSGADEESAAARARGGIASSSTLELDIRVLGVRPGGELPSNSPVLAALRDADAYLGNQSRLERSSTDANIPLSMGIQAISIGAGGSSGGAHTLNEWYDSAGREMGLKRVLLTLLGVAGIASGGSR